MGFWFSLALLLVLAVAVYAFPYPVHLLSLERSAPLRVLDRHGTLLRSVPAADGSPGREGWVSLDRISPLAVLTVLASEDRRFFEHRGVDPLAVLRAVWLNVSSGRLAFGGSTITMQLVKQIHSRGRARSLWTKLRETVLALRLERAMDKRAILEQYLNRVYYGNGAWGLQSAARTYFGRPAASLSAGEATLLAIVPRGPQLYDLLRHLPRALRRRDHVLGLLLQRGLLTPEEVRRARSQPLRPRLHRSPFHAPHLVDWVLATLPAGVRQRGGALQTTLDLPLQQDLERRVAGHVAGQRRRRLGQAGMVVLSTASGEVLAMVGSAGFSSTPDGQINIVTRRRHPGSALKPFVYALALEAGDNPGSIAYDIPDVPSAYRPLGLTQPEHGPVPYRQALACSYNLAAVHVLERVGVERLVSRLRRASVGTLEGDPADYGLRLALGSAKVRLLDLAAAYGFLVRQGSVIAPSAVLQVTRADSSIWRPSRPAERQVFSPQVSWLVMDMLADPEARRPAFGQELPLDLPFLVAAKTGTARGFADTMAVGVTRELTVAAWAGNFDGRPTHGLVAMEAAAPLVRDGLLLAGRGRALTLPPRPRGITSEVICPVSGMLATDRCPHRRREHFVAGRQPGRRCSWHQLERGRLTVRYPVEIAPWARRQRTAGGRHL